VSATAPSSIDSTPRECGGCNVCCTAMHVRALDKPAGTPCEHQSDAGCGIYADRPETCRVWYCMWVRDAGQVFDDAHRPDQLNVFFTASKVDPQTGKQTIYAHETRPDAAKSLECCRLLAMFKKVAPVEVLLYKPPTTNLTVSGREVA